jgi:hypothetical protein
MITLTIPEAVPSGNALLWKHWRVKHRHRVHWAWLVRCAKMDAQVAGCVNGSPWGSNAVIRGVTIERYGKRKLDHDNYVAGCKALIDALVSEGLLKGDGPDQVEVTYRQQIGQPDHTVVTIGQAPA